MRLAMDIGLFRNRLRIEREVGQLDFGDFVSSVAFATGLGTAG